MLINKCNLLRTHTHTHTHTHICYRYVYIICLLSISFAVTVVIFLLFYIFLLAQKRKKLGQKTGGYISVFVPAAQLWMGLITECWLWVTAGWHPGSYFSVDYFKWFHCKSLFQWEKYQGQNLHKENIMQMQILSDKRLLIWNFINHFVI